ncbi:DUF3343 domain-containing protein [Sporanaerobacter acetigenes]|uniref:Putative Se/S carrier protein-like domain-containing protein n=1 Tax=Sporanaerobacter acetigenes DSM 13106 TaxID=1123281 RepID=A0A1M5X973_9FIRM|nr:DUF3343 domain-containing protein [Sporanaerobacter acetigenes]SHH96212.1 Protein of unknown function [Sporanaerobacter acetigenes DSM 13106]
MSEYVAIFFTHSGAIKFDRKLKSYNIECELMPVPRKLSSNCGIGAKFKYDKDIIDLIDEEIEKIFIVEGKEYKLVYSE